MHKLLNQLDYSIMVKIVSFYEKRNGQKNTTATAITIITVYSQIYAFHKHSGLLLYGSVSQGLGTTKFTNLIG